MKIQNIRCSVCGSMCQDETVRTFTIWAENHRVVDMMGIGKIVFNVCELCLWPEEEPIPFIVTEKGMAESMRQLAKEKENA